MTDPKPISQLTDDELQQFINHQNTQTQTYYSEREKAENAAKKTPAYQKLDDEIKQHDKQDKKFEKNIDERKCKLAERYIDIDYDDRARGVFFVRYNRTRYDNVRPATIDAIKATFKWKLLSGAAVENIVNALIKEAQDRDPIIKECKKRCDTLHAESRALEDEKTTLKQKVVDRVKYDPPCDLREVEIHLSRKLLAENKDTTELREAVNNSYERKRAVENYRLECVRNAGKVLAKLKGV